MRVTCVDTKPGDGVDNGAEKEPNSQQLEPTTAVVALKQFLFFLFYVATIIYVSTHVHGVGKS